MIICLQNKAIRILAAISGEIGRKLRISIVRDFQLVETLRFHFNWERLYRHVEMEEFTNQRSSFGSDSEIPAKTTRIEQINKVMGK